MSSPSVKSSAVPSTPRRRWWALGFVLAGNLAVFAAVTMMNVAIPAAREDLGLSGAGQTWIVTLYSLSFAASMLLGGKIADVLGLRTTMVAGLFGFAAASLLGGLAANQTMLLIARALQGVTGALVAATALALMSVMFADGPARARAFAVFGIVMGIGTAASFTLAGVFVDTLSWRWCLLFNVPVALITIVGLLRTAPAGTAARGGRIDLVGAVLVTAAMAILVVGLNRAPELGWSDPTVPVMLGVAVVLVAAFAIGLRRSRNPLIPSRILTDRRRAAAFLGVLSVGIGAFGGMFILTTVQQDLLGFGALATGLGFLPYGLSAIVASEVVSRLPGRIAPGTQIAVGLLLAAAALGSTALLEPDSSYLGGVLPAMLLLGAGATVVMLAGSNAATLGAGSDSGVASAMVNSSQQLGAAVGTALLTSVISAATQSSAAAGAPKAAASLHGFAMAGTVGAGILVAMAVSIIVLTRLGETDTRQA